MLLLTRSRRALSPSLVRTLANATPATTRALAATVSDNCSSSPPLFSEKRTAVDTLKESTGLVVGASKRSLYSSSRGTNSGFAYCSPSEHESFNLRGATFTASTVRCEATVAEKELSPVEKFEYQAEVARLLDLIVHSLYSNKEVFLRELVSNASDALDKLRFLSVTQPELLSANSNLEIRLKTDAEKGTITITDTGVGMTREELVQSLGTIAESGTAKFLKALKENKDNPPSDSNLIGQFGVGFYSAFLVANKITVSSKSVKSDRQYLWEGEADTSVYTIREETDPEMLIPRGTSITLYLKDDSKDEYTDPLKIKTLVKNYSQFISFPIYTFQEITESKEGDDGDEDVIMGAEVTKKEGSEKHWDWELTNDTKPIWLREAKDVTKADYNEFFKSTFKEFLAPMAHTHFSTEGEIEFKSLIYIPSVLPQNSDDPYSQRAKNIRLYVKRVFISDEFQGDLLPRYLGFVKGVVDSNDLPLNVSREILQASHILSIMKKRLLKKIFDMIDGIAKNDDKNEYKQFWSQYAKPIKLGCIEDAQNHKRLAPLLRFCSSKTPDDELTSLDDYMRRMKKEQKYIYYLAADTVRSAKSAPFLEVLSKRDLEVLFLVDPVDEVAIGHIKTYKDKEFIDVSKENLDLESGDTEKDKELEEEFQGLCDWIKGFLGDRVVKVKISNRLSSSPCVLVSGKFSWSANMERIMKAQTLGVTPELEGFMRAGRVLEINPNHPIMEDLNFICKDTPDDPKAKHMVELLFDTAQLASGFTPENPAAFGGRVYEMMAMAIQREPESVEESVEPTPNIVPASSATQGEVVEAETR